MHFLSRDHTTYICDHAIPYIKQTGKSPEIIFPTELPRLSPFYNHTGQWSITPTVCRTLSMNTLPFVCFARKVIPCWKRLLWQNAVMQRISVP